VVFQRTRVKKTNVNRFIAVCKHIKLSVIVRTSLVLHLSANTRTRTSRSYALEYDSQCYFVNVLLVGLVDCLRTSHHM
jgi:hypothetical protein